MRCGKKTYNRKNLHRCIHFSYTTYIIHVRCHNCVQIYSVIAFLWLSLASEKSVWHEVGTKPEKDSISR